MPEIAPIVGQPVAYGMGVVVLFVLGLSQFVGQYPLTFAHEGGHLLAAVVLLRPIKGFTMADNTEALTLVENRRWSIGNLLYLFAGYPCPALLGWGGAALIASDRGWFVLILGLLFCLMALVVARNGLAILIPSLLVLGIGWALWLGTPAAQAALIVGIVWYLLIGALVDAVKLPAKGGDALALAQTTGLIPGFVWKLVWNVIAIVCLIKGGTLLLAA
jgi:hypothetical protein